MLKFTFEQIKNLSKKEIQEILKNPDNISDMEWKVISSNPNFHPSMVEEFYFGLLSWEHITIFRQLSISDIEKYKEYVDWYAVSALYKLPADFVNKFVDRLSLDKLVDNQALSRDVHELAEKLLAKNNDPEHHLIWDDNLRKSTTFCPRNFVGRYKDYKVPRKAKKVKKKPVDYSSMKKADLKQILIKRGVRVYYHDTLDILIQKCKESEAGNSGGKRKKV